MLQGGSSTCELFRDPDWAGVSRRDRAGDKTDSIKGQGVRMKDKAWVGIGLMQDG